MPRGPRLDAPAALHHVMVRGLDRQPVFGNDRDREDFVRRLADLVKAGALTVLAWALLPNHAHLLVRTGTRPLGRSMRSLLTGYAGSFNRRHKRSGHLFQNRYKSTLVEEETYLLELVRYLHLNPLRAGLLPDFASLDRYPWTGHSVLMGYIARSWQATDEILQRFGGDARRARHGYRAFMAAGTRLGQRPDLQGGGLVRSLGGWEAVAALRRGREAYASDERILGNSTFVESMLSEVERQEARLALIRRRTPGLPVLLERVAAAVQLLPEALTGGARNRTIARARDGLAYLWTEVLGRSGRELARFLKLHPVSVCRAARRGRAHGAEWRRVALKES